MCDEIRYEGAIVNNKMANGKRIDRIKFACIKMLIPTKGKWIQDVTEKAYSIENLLNSKQANSSELRSKEIVHIDNLAGVIAEHACYKFLCDYMGEEFAKKPKPESSANQIDIMIRKNNKTIEVRSSCARNNIGFVIFAKKDNKSKQQYFDVIGPYENQYKRIEVIKDYYMRAFYHCDKGHFLDLLDHQDLELYITGGATKEMLEDDKKYQIKKLIPEDAIVKRTTPYHVIPLGASLDINEFFEVLCNSLHLDTQLRDWKEKTKLWKQAQ